METPSIALAPRLLLFSVPSISMRRLSMYAWSSASSPSISGTIVLFTLLTAFVTPFPLYLPGSPSLSSSASHSPVDAPEGTMALPMAPLSSVISTSTVGFPLLSSTSLANTSYITDIRTSLLFHHCFIGKSLPTTM